MKKYILTIFSFLIWISGEIHAQYPGEIWYFGQFAGIDFNNNPPTPLTDGKINTQEGCATMCDQSGNLIMYTDGVTVWNKNHEIMENGSGLFGHSSSSQSAIIVKQPGGNPYYYIFTTTYFIHPEGLCYSVVDISQNDGLGAAIEKNTQLLTPVGEKLTTIRHDNGSDYWVIAHKFNSKDFYAYQLTESGLSLTPVISTTGTTHQGGQNNAIGYMRPSPSGEKLAVSIYDQGVVDVLSFNKANGTIQLQHTLPGNYRTYCSEFSPNNQLLYVKYLYSGNIYQYNLEAGSTNDIINSKTRIGVATNDPTPVDYISGALQLGIDNKIYVVKFMDEYLGRIENPNILGTGCHFVDDAFHLQGGLGRLGLPYAGKSINAVIKAENFCFNDTTRFWFEGIDTQNIDSVLWDFGDPASGFQNNSVSFTPFHIFSAPGEFNVQLSIYFTGDQLNISNNIVIHPSPQPNLGNDTVVCSSESLVLDPGNNFSSYFWQNGSEDSTFLATESGLYWVQVTNEFGCMAADSVNISFAPELNISIGNDSTLCEGNTLMLCAGSGYADYLWQDGSVDSCFTATTSGSYWVRVTDEYQCVAFDTVNLVFLPSAEFTFGPDTLICYNETLLLDPGEGYESYLWQDGSQGQSFLVSEPGLYWVQVSNQCGAGGDTISVDFTEPYDISLGNDTSFCYGHSIILDPGAGYTSYLWDDGSELQFNTVSTGGYHWVEVTDSLGCTAMDSIYIDVFNSFEISIGEDSLHICEGEYVFLNGPDGFETYQWQDGSDFLSILADTAGIYWLEVTDENGCAARDSVYLFVNIIPDTLLGNDTVICPDETIQLTAKPGYEAYVWQDGSTGTTFTADHAGLYWVTVQDEIGCMGTDSIFVSDFEIPGLGLAEQEWLCRDDTLTLDAGGGHLSYLWNDGSRKQTLEVTSEGIYSVDIGTICGIYTDMVDVRLYEGDMDLGADTTLCTNEYLVLTPGGGYTNFLWSTGSTDSTLLVSSAGDYWLSAFDGFCMVSDTIVIDACATLIVPNVFTPNSDGKNDTFYAKATDEEGILNFKMVIFNRWGRIVHTLNDVSEHWNGKINNSDAAEGVYFWVCDYSARDKYGNINAHSQQGDVTLIR